MTANIGYCFSGKYKDYRRPDGRHIESIQYIWEVFHPKKVNRMCLAIPGKIISIDLSTPELAMAKVDFGGITKEICVQWVEAVAGDYVLAHAGMAIATVDPVEAAKTLEAFDAMARSL
jgi:hydrogenase expression/formation protein HypC